VMISVDLRYLVVLSCGKCRQPVGPISST